MRRVWGRTGLLAACAFAALVCISLPAGAETKEVVLNGDAAKGSAEQPDNWRTEAWEQAPEDFHGTWIHPANGESGQLEVENFKADDARWQQSITLSPGWYRFGGEVRTENVGSKETGATISILE